MGCGDQCWKVIRVLHQLQRVEHVISSLHGNIISGDDAMAHTHQLGQDQLIQHQCLQLNVGAGRDNVVI